MPELSPYMQYITIGQKKEMYTGLSNTNYPTLIFTLLIDSKADINIKIEEILVYVYMESCFMGKIRWNQLDNELEEIQPLLARGSIWVNLHFTPPKDFLKSPMPKRWNLNGIVLFGAENYVQARKKFSILFKMKDHEFKSALETYFRD